MNEKSKGQEASLIVGNGRSGTNLLLQLLDLSEHTHCRNEPHGIARSPFASLPAAEAFARGAAGVAEAWDHAVHWTATHYGERDHRPQVKKNHVYGISHWMKLDECAHRPRLKGIVHALAPPAGVGEWRQPWWLGDRGSLARAHAVLKINDLKAWQARWVLKERPETRVIHIVRHPGGQLNSAIQRFFSKLDREALQFERRLYQGFLKQAISLEPAWKPVLGDIDAMDLYEAVMHFWLYNNDAIADAGETASQYRLVIYEELVADPESHVSDLFAFLGLPFASREVARIAKAMNKSVWGKLSVKPEGVAGAWREKLQENESALAERVLQKSAHRKRFEA